jgi:chorismate lyase/3-hydroxybenzoate synthase
LKNISSKFYVDFGQDPPEKHDKLLNVFRFSNRTCREGDHIHLALQPLNEQYLYEHWISETEIMRGKDGNIFWTKSEDYLFANLLLEEKSLDDIENIAYDTYSEIMSFLEKSGYCYLLRVWNYLPDLSYKIEELNRYQTFCKGRHRALSQNPKFINLLPAATVVGTQAPGLLIYFIAAKKSGIPIENPRQVSAFHYPIEYGVASPKFSRAMLNNTGEEYDYYISGTASIVGHSSKHIDHVADQAQEILRNQAILLEELKFFGKHHPQVEDLPFQKVYLSDREYLQPVKEYLNTVFPNKTKLLYLLGEVCRPELKVEMETIYFS